MNQFNAALINIKLQSDLQKFGLNPVEWSLQRIQTSLSYLIKHRFDENFAMYGELEFRKNKPQWKSIAVISL